MNYLERFYRVLRYIDSNLEGDLSINSLSNVAGFSKYHFHRQFSLLFGISVYAYIRRLRMRKATYQLAFRDEIKVIDVALMSGYESSEAFSRAFKEFQGQSPQQFRNNPDWVSWRENNDSLNELRIKHMASGKSGNKAMIVQFQEIRVAIIEHRGSPDMLMETVRQFIAWRKENKLSPKVSRTFNIVYDDPSEVRPEDYRMDICCTVPSKIKDNSYGVYSNIIPEGRCAVIRHTGSDENIGKTVGILYSAWLPDSGEELRDYPLFFERVNFFPDVPEEEVVTDVFLPLK